MAVQGRGNQDLKEQLNNNSQALQKAPTVQGLLETPKYKKRFEEILKNRAAQFMASIINVSRGMDAEPNSIIMAAAVAATLDLPVDKNLGYAWIVPYKEKDVAMAQFQMGWKGYVQLALRTAQYKGIGCVVAYEGEVKNYDELLGIADYEPRDDIGKDEKPVGYIAKFRLLNGFEKTLYWKKDRVERHAKTYSQSYKSNKDWVVKACRWTIDFDAMAMKTVIKQLLSKWGILSIEMQKAIKADDGVINSENLDDDKSVDYVDNVSYTVSSSDEPEPARMTPKEALKIVTDHKAEIAKNEAEGQQSLLSEDRFAGTPFAQE